MEFRSYSVSFYNFIIAFRKKKKKRLLLGVYMVLISKILFNEFLNKC